MKVDQDVMRVLSASSTEGNKLFIVGGQLERNLYMRLDKVLKAANGKWNTKAKAHIFPGDASDAIENIILTGEVTVPQDFGYFPTPAAVVDRLIEYAQLEDGMSALEPSAGQGAIARALASVGVTVDCVELLPDNAKHLMGIELYGTVMVADFMSIHPLPSYDRVVMNPPFDKKRSDIHHVMHALRFLKPGGLLVSVMPSGVMFRDDALTRDLRGLIESRSGQIISLPTGSFKESGTMVNSVIVVIPA